MHCALISAYLLTRSFKISQQQQQQQQQQQFQGNSEKS
jgi:hypothetical protein